MATTTTALLNVVQIDDRAGNHYWIFDVYHTTGTDTNIEVPHSIVSAAQIPTGAATAGDVTIIADDTATDAVREIQIDTTVGTGLIKLIAKFTGSAAGMGSGHEDL